MISEVLTKITNYVRTVEQQQEGVVGFRGHPLGQDDPRRPLHGAAVGADLNGMKLRPEHAKICKQIQAEEKRGT